MLSHKELFRYTWPLALTSLGSIIVSLTDTLVIGNYSTEALAGVALGAAIYELLIESLLSALIAYRILLPRVTGADKQVRDLAGMFIIFRLLIPVTVILTVMALIGSWFLFQLAGDPAWQATGAYLLGRSLAMPARVISSALVSSLIVWGFPKAPLITFLIFSVTNLVLDVVLVYGIGPAPELGALGDGLASSAGAWLVLPWLVLKIRKNMQPAENREAVRLQFVGWGKIALPSVYSNIVDYAGNLLFVTIISFSGAATLAGVRIGQRLEVLAFILVSSLSSAALILLGRVYGKAPHRSLEELPRVRKLFLLWSFLLGIVLLALAWPLALITSPDPQVRTVTMVAIAIVFLLCPMLGWCYANVLFLRVMALTKQDFISNSIAVWGAQIPFALLGFYFFEHFYRSSLTAGGEGELAGLVNGGVGAYSGIVAYWLTRAVITHFQVLRVRQKTLDADAKV